MDAWLPECRQEVSMRLSRPPELVPLQGSLGPLDRLLQGVHEEAVQLIPEQRLGRSRVDDHPTLRRMQPTAVNSRPIRLGNRTAKLEDHIDAEVSPGQIYLAQLVCKCSDLRALWRVAAVNDSERECDHRLVPKDASAFFIEPMNRLDQVSWEGAGRLLKAVLVV